jgi:hypothetical protein
MKIITSLLMMPVLILDLNLRLLIMLTFWTFCRLPHTLRQGLLLQRLLWNTIISRSPSSNINKVLNLLFLLNHPDNNINSYRPDLQDNQHIDLSLLNTNTIHNNNYNNNNNNNNGTSLILQLDLDHLLTIEW